MKDYIYLIDFCSTGPELKIQGDTKKKSILGVIVSLIIAFIMIFLVIYLGLDVVQKKKPSVIISNISGKEPTFLELTSKNLLLGWKVTDNDGNTIDSEGYLTIDVVNTIGTVSNDPSRPWNTEERNLSNDKVTCNTIKDNDGRASVSLLTSYYCPKELNITWGGYYSNSKYGRIDITVSPCKGKDNCKSSQQISDFVNIGLYLTTYFPDSSVNPKSKDSPITTSYTPLLIGISNDLYVTYRRFYQNLIIKSDLGFLLEDYRKINSYIYSYDSVIYQSRQSDSNSNYIWYAIFLLPNQSVYERTYMKVQDVAATVGGLFKIFWVMGILIMYPISSLGVETEIMNQIYDFSQYSDLKGKSDNNTSQNFFDKMKNNLNDNNPKEKDNDKIKNSNTGNIKNHKSKAVSINVNNSNNYNNVSSFVNLNKIAMSENKDNNETNNYNHLKIPTQPFILSSNPGISKSSMIHINQRLNKNNNSNNFSVLENLNNNKNKDTTKFKSIVSSHNFNNENYENSNIAFRENEKESDKSIDGNNDEFHNDNSIVKGNSLNNNKDNSNNANDEINNINLQKKQINSKEKSKSNYHYQFLLLSSYIQPYYLLSDNFDEQKGKIDMLELNFIQRLHSLRLRFTNCELLSYFCPFRRCKSKEHLFKLSQYNSCINEINQYSNFDYIIKKIKEMEFIKAVIFNREQAMAFNFFHKPYIGDKDQIFSKASNQIHHDLLLTPREQVKEITKYFIDMTKKNTISEFDEKILDLLDVNN